MLALTVLAAIVVALVIVAVVKSRRPATELVPLAPSAEVASRLPQLSSLSLWGALGLGACIGIWTATLYGFLWFRSRSLSAQARVEATAKRMEELEKHLHNQVYNVQEAVAQLTEAVAQIQKGSSHLERLATLPHRPSGHEHAEPPPAPARASMRAAVDSISLRPGAPPPEPGQKEICESFVEFCQTTEKDFAIAEASRFQKLLGEKYPQMKARVRSVFRDQVSGPNDTRIYADAAQARDPVTYWLVESGGRPVLLPAPRRLDQFAQIAPVFEAATTLQPRSLGEIHPPLIDVTGDGWSLRKPGQVTRRPE
jgi:hypothetical protein